MADETGKYSFFAKAVIAIALLTVLVLIFVPGFSETEDSIINRIFFYYQDPDDMELSVQERAHLLENTPQRIKEAFDEASDKEFCIGSFDRFDIRFFDSYDLAILNEAADIDVRPIRKDQHPSVQTILSSPRIVQNTNPCIITGDSAEELVSIIRNINEEGYSRTHLDRFLNLNPVQTSFTIYRFKERDIRSNYIYLEYNNTLQDNLVTERFRHGLNKEYFIKTPAGICLIPVRNNVLNWWAGTWSNSCRTNEGVLRSSCIESLEKIARENNLECSSQEFEGARYTYEFRVDSIEQEQGVQIVKGTRLNLREDSTVTTINLINDQGFSFEVGKNYSFKTSLVLKFYNIDQGRVSDCAPEYDGTTVVNPCNFVGFKTSEINVEVIE